MHDFIHNDPEFKELLTIVSSKKGIDITLIEKDYWIMHALFSLQQQGIAFELKGGTSLSKGFGLIHRFSEDIDIHIRTNFGLEIEGKEDKPKVRAARKEFYDVLANSLSMNGIKGADKQIPLKDHPALLLTETEHRASFKSRYQSTSKLYYNGQPDFEEVLARIQMFLPML